MFLRFIIIAIFLFPLSLSAKEIREGIFLYKYSDFTSGRIKDCPVVNTPDIGQKIHHENNSGPPLTDAEMTSLVGGANFFGLSGGDRFYSRKTKRIWPIMESYMLMQGYDINNPATFSNPQALAAMQSFSPNKIDGNTPVLCGDGWLEKDMKRYDREKREYYEAKHAEYLKNCKMCKLRGGDYLETIYRGDYDKQSQLARNYTSYLSGGSELAALGAIIDYAGGAKKLTLLEEVIGGYMLSSSRNWPKSCYGSGTERVTFTLTFPEQTYETLGGVYLGSDPATISHTHYMVKPQFKSACNQFCNKHSGMLLKAVAVGATKITGVFGGIDDLVKQHDCHSPEIKQFESNLLKMWAQERN